MRAKNLLQLLTLSTNLYMISKDEEFMENLSEMMKKGKDKVADFVEGFTEEGEEDHEQLIQKFMHKAKQAKAEFEKKMEEVAVKVYSKMHVANADDLNAVVKRLEIIEKKIQLVEAQIINLGSK